jgi:hypothetical protein
VWGVNASGFLPRLLLGFVAGALAVVFFHQGAITFMNGLGWVPNPGMRQTLIPPYGVPAVWNAAFWGGLWGVVFALIEPRFRSLPLVVAAILFCITLPLLTAWVIVPSIKGGAMFAGGNILALLRQVLVYAIWGLGLAVFWTSLPALLGGARRTA